VQPLIPEFDRIAKVQGPTALAEEVARLQMMTGSSVILGALVAPHPRDRTRMTIYLGDASLGLGVDNYLKPDAQRIRSGYVAMITDYLVDRGLEARGSARDRADGACGRNPGSQEEAHAAGEARPGQALRAHALRRPEAAHVQRRPGRVLPVDGHPPGVYRMAAPSQHEQGYFDAFGIRAGDRMWLDPNDRATIW